MNFDIICKNCGAPSSPATGICPFCKAVMTSKEIKATPSFSKVRSLYNEGDIEDALALAKALEDKKPDLLSNVDFVLLYVQVLLETDGPSSKMKSLLSRALLDNPDDPRIAEYLEIIEAKSCLSHEKNDAGEQMLSNIIRRSPENAHALFLLGSHLFWVENETQQSLRYLEKCVSIRPRFLKAIACLAALYKKLNLDDNAARLLIKCSSLSSSPHVKRYFKDLSSLLK